MKNEKLRVPKLRFKEFSGEWVTTDIKSIGTFFSGGTPTSSNKSYYEGNIPFIGSGKIGANRVEQFITQEALNNSSAKIVEVGDLLYALYGATSGEVAISKIKGAINQAVLCIRTAENKMFLKTWLEKNKEKILSTYLQGGQGNLSAKIVKSLKLNLPQKQEQEKIASFLSSIDKKINQLSKKDELLQNYKKAMMQKIFSQKLRFKKADGSDYPKWEEKKLGEITYKVSRKNKDNISYPVYSINNKEGFVPQSEQFEGMDSNSRNYDISLYKIIDENTFAYNPARINVGSLGYSYQLKDIIISSLYVCFKTNDDINDNFLLQYFTTFEFNKSVLRNTEGGVRDYLFYENFSNIKINLPSLEEQTKIANFLSSLDTKISQNKKALEETQKFKKALLQKMFV